MESFTFRSRLESIRGKPTWHAWFEMLLIMSLSVTLSAVNRPYDPFFLQAPFPWPALGPVLVGLRYGFFFSFISVLIELGCIGISLEAGWWTHNGFPYDYAIGITAIAMLVGEFRDVWGRRIDRLQESNDYRQIRLNEFTRNYHLLKVSHDRLEQQVAGSGHSLREGLRFIRKKMSGYSYRGITSDVAESMLTMLSEYGYLQKASLFVAKRPGDADFLDEDEDISEVSSADLSTQKERTQEVASGPIKKASKIGYGLKKRRSILRREPIAKLGFSEGVSHQDPLIERCLKSRCLVSLRPEFSDAEFTTSQLLACVPLIDAENQIWAVVAVEMMPFFSFQDKTLRLLAVLAGHMADLVNQHSQVVDIADEDFARFRLNLKRALHDQITFGIPSALVVFDVENTDQGKHFMALVKRMQRGLDLIVEQTRDEETQLLLLLPLTDELGVESYRQRIDDSMRSEAGTPLSEAPVKLYRHFLEDSPSLDQFTQQRIWNGHEMASISSHII
jgi:hypothetical protein